jgi:hypothetical protein
VRIVAEGADSVPVADFLELMATIPRTGAEAERPDTLQ